MRRLLPSLDKRKRQVPGHGTTFFAEKNFSIIDLLAGTYTGGAMSVPDVDGTLVSVPADIRAVQGGTWGGSVFTRPIAAGGGVVSKPATANTLSYDEDISNAAWTKTNLSVGAGAESSNRLVPSTSNAQHLFLQSTTKAASAKTYTCTFEAVAAGYDFLVVRIDGGAGDGVSAAFNVNTGAISTALGTAGSGWTAIDAGIEQRGNFYRGFITYTTASETINRFVGYVSNATGFFSSAPSFAGDGVSGVDLLYVDFQESAFPLPHVSGASSATVHTYDASKLQAQNCGVMFYVKPMGVMASAQWLFSNYKDAANYFGVYSTAFTTYLRKVVASVTTDLPIAYSLSTDGFWVQAYCSDAGMGIAIRPDSTGVWSSWTTNANSTALSLATTIQAGSRNGTGQFAGYLGNTEAKLRVFNATSGAVLIAKMESAR